MDTKEKGDFETMSFASELTYKEIKQRILTLMDTKVFRELEGYLSEIRRRKKVLRKRIIFEMSEFKELLEA